MKIDNYDNIYDTEDTYSNEDNPVLQIIYTKDGYSIICTDGTPMEFTSGDSTVGIKSLKDAIKICRDNEYSFEIIG